MMPNQATTHSGPGAATSATGSPGQTPAPSSCSAKAMMAPCSRGRSHASGAEPRTARRTGSVPPPAKFARRLPTMGASPGTLPAGPEGAVGKVPDEEDVPAVVEPVGVIQRDLRAGLDGHVAAPAEADPRLRQDRELHGIRSRKPRAAIERNVRHDLDGREHGAGPGCMRPMDD